MSLKKKASRRTDVFHIDAREIVVREDWNARDFDAPDNKAHVEALKESIKERGVLEPLTVQMIDDEPVLTNGECRLRAVLALSEEAPELSEEAPELFGEDGSIPVPVRTENRNAEELERLSAQIVRNSGKPFSPMEKATVVRRMLEESLDEYASVAKLLGLSEERVKQLHLLSSATKKTQTMVAKGQVSATTVQREIEKHGPKKAEQRLKDAEAKAKASGKDKVRPKDLSEPREKEKKPVEEPIRLTYTNYKGDTSLREVFVQRVFWGSTEYHPDEQYLLEVLDTSKRKKRVFALKDCDFTTANQTFSKTLSDDDLI